MGSGHGTEAGAILGYCTPVPVNFCCVSQFVSRLLVLWGQYILTFILCVCVHSRTETLYRILNNSFLIFILTKVFPPMLLIAWAIFFLFWKLHIALYLKIKGTWEQPLLLAIGYFLDVIAKVLKGHAKCVPLPLVSLSNSPVGLLKSELLVCV